MRQELIFIAILALTIGYVQATENSSKVCYSCASDYIPGIPVVGGKTLGELALHSEDMLSKKDSVFVSDVSIYCEDFHRGDDAEKTMKEKIIPEMKKYSPNGSIDGFFIEAGCNPRKFANAKSPIAHIAAESPTYRVEHLKFIKKYYQEQNRPELFEKIINAKNTSGFTSLDYVQHMFENRIYVKDVEKGMNEFIKYLCDNEATYSIYKEKKKCDGKYLLIP